MPVYHAIEELPGHGVTVVDTGFQRPHFDAAYLVVEAGCAAFVDTGTNAAVPRLLQALSARALQPADVEWVIVTHVHLDHAGGAGLLMRHLPNAKLVVHPRGARHLASPSQLLAAVRAVYGEQAVQRDYGELLPVPGERILATEDEMVLHLAKRPLRILHTPGHARHHLCVWDEASRGCFVGDTLGVSYREFRNERWHYGLPSTSPVQFDPAALRASIARIVALQPRIAYITHYGALGEVAAQAELVLRQSETMTWLARALSSSPRRGAALRKGLRSLYLRVLRERKVDLSEDESMSLLEGDIELNAQGLEVWLEEARPAHA